MDEFFGDCCYSSFKIGYIELKLLKIRPARLFGGETETVMLPNPGVLCWMTNNSCLVSS